MLGNATVTDTSRPLFQLNPTRGLTPVDSSRSLSTAFAWLNPSVTVLTASHAARLIAKTETAAILNIDAPDIVIANTTEDRAAPHARLRSASSGLTKNSNNCATAFPSA